MLRSPAKRRCARPVPRPDAATGSCRCGRSTGSRRDDWPAAVRRSSCGPRTTRGECVRTFMPSRDREGTTGHEVRLPFDFDHAHPAGPAGRQAFDVAERGHLTARPAQRGQEHFASARPRPSAVDFNVRHDSFRISSLSVQRPDASVRLIFDDGLEPADVQAAAAADALVRDRCSAGSSARRRSPRSGISSAHSRAALHFSGSIRYVTSSGQTPAGHWRS